METTSSSAKLVDARQNLSEKDRLNLTAAIAYSLADERDFKNFNVEKDPLKDWDEAKKKVERFVSGNA